MIQIYTATLTEKKLVTADVLFLSFALENPKEVDFQAGQYLVTMVPTAGETARRLYSIASPSYEKSSFDLVVKVLQGGVASEYFNRLKVGEPTTFEGPAGRFILRGTQKHKL